MRCRISAARATDLVRALVNWFQDPTLLCRDFNAHHHLSGDKRDDPLGRVLAEALKDCGPAFGNYGSPTFFCQQSSFITSDVTSHSPARPIACKRAPDTMGSDQYPIIFSILGFSRSAKRRVRVTNWDKYRTIPATFSEPYVTPSSSV